MMHLTSVWALIGASTFVGLFCRPDFVAAQSTAPVITLAQAVRMALESNPELAAARQRVQAARARADQAGYLEDPEISVQSWSIPLHKPLDFNRADTNMVGIQQKLPFPGKRKLKSEIARQEARMVDSDYRAKEREIVSQVKMAYADLFLAARSRDAYKDQLEILGRARRTVEALYQVGKAPQQDLLKTQVEETTIQNTLIQVNRERLIAEARLNSLLFRPSRSEIAPESALKLPDISFDLVSLEGLAEENRPEIQSAGLEVKRAEAGVALAEKNRKYPDFMVGWMWWHMPTGEVRNSHQGTVNITVPFSPWTSGRHRAETAEAQSVLETARAGRLAVMNTTRQEIQEAHAKTEAAMNSLKLYREGLMPQAELALQSALSAYETGRAGFTAVLEAERTVTETRLNYYQTQAQLLQNLGALERAIGTDLTRILGETK
jgi:outer membrane protein TolC